MASLTGVFCYVFTLDPVTFLPLVIFDCHREGVNDAAARLKVILIVMNFVLPSTPWARCVLGRLSAAAVLTECNARGRAAWGAADMSEDLCAICHDRACSTAMANWRSPTAASIDFAPAAS